MHYWILAQKCYFLKIPYNIQISSFLTIFKEITSLDPHKAMIAKYFLPHYTDKNTDSGHIFFVQVQTAGKC